MRISSTFSFFFFCQQFGKFATSFSREDGKTRCRQCLWRFLFRSCPPPCASALITKINQVWCCSRSTFRGCHSKKHTGEAKIQKYTSCVSPSRRTTLSSFDKKIKKKNKIYIYISNVFAVRRNQRVASEKRPPPKARRGIFKRNERKRNETKEEFVEEKKEKNNFGAFLHQNYSFLGTSGIKSIK